LCESGRSRFCTPEIPSKADFGWDWKLLTANWEAITLSEGFLTDQLPPNPEQARLPSRNPSWYASSFQSIRGIYPPIQQRQISESRLPRSPHNAARCRQSIILSPW
jgi:hypothetical protein